MRVIGLLFLMLVLVSCGQDGSGGNRSTAAQNGTDNSDGWDDWGTQGTGNCRLSDGREVGCESLRGADGLGVDLLDTMVDVRVQLTGSEIVFQESKVSSKEGRRINCQTAVSAGESYSYSLMGSSLQIRTPDGKSYTMKKLNESSPGIQGAWGWRGYTVEGVHLIRQLTVVGDSRAIIQTHCEL